MAREDLIVGDGGRGSLEGARKSDDLLSSKQPVIL